MSSARRDPAVAGSSTGLLHTALRLGTVTLAAVAVSAHFTDYGPLIPLLERELHITSGATGLLSTLLYVGIGLSYLPGGWLVDRFGPRRVLFGTLLLVAAGGCLLPLFPDLAWIVVCRLVVGLGAGAAIIAGSLVARQGRYAALGLGLFGGAMQLGAGLGLLVTPALLGFFGWQGTFVAWGALGLCASLLCLCTLSSETPQLADAAHRGIAAAFRSPSLWTLGLVLLGTLGLGQAIAPWLAVYFARSYGLPLALAAMLGAVGLLAGMLFPPLGGLLLSHKVFTPGAVMCVGTAMACLGVGLLALPFHAVLVTGWGLALFGCGTTLPYAAVFDEASSLGTESTLGPGIAQGVVSVISSPASAFGPPLIGQLLGLQSSFVLPFVVMVLPGVIAFIASLFVGPLLARTRKETDLRQRRAQQGDVTLEEILRGHSRISRPASALPLIVTLGAFAHNRSTPIIRHLQRAGGLPLLLPREPSPLHGDVGDILADEDFFQETFDRRIWPLFCQLLAGETRGLCLIEGSKKARETNGTRTSGERSLSPRVVPDPWSAIIQRYLALLAWLVGMPVLGAGWELQSLQLHALGAARRGTEPEWIWSLPAESAVCSGDADEPGACAQFVAACAAYQPPSAEELSPLRDRICDWLRRRDRVLVRQLYQLQLAYGQETMGMCAALAATGARQAGKQQVASKGR